VQVPSWSADDRDLLVFSNRSGREQLYRMPALGGPLVAIGPSAGNDESPSVSPDGKRIAFVSDRAGTRDVYVMEVDGSAGRKLTDGLGARGVSWSPDGGRLVFSAEARGVSEIYVLELAGAPPRRLSTGFEGTRESVN
jgi:TolB protein